MVEPHAPHVPMDPRCARRAAALPRTTAWAVLLAALATHAHAHAQQPAADPWATFQKLPVAKQLEVVAALRADAPQHPLARALAPLAAAADQAGPQRARLRTVQRAARAIEFPRDVVTLPRRVVYLFGVGAIAPRDGKPAAPAQKPGKPAARPAAKPGAAAPAPPHACDGAPLHQALLGVVPDADRALAELERRLDSDTGADEFAAFLQTWRNDDESFYEALDRTAGTKDSVFFFDAMLSDFRAQFGSGKGAAALGGGLQVAHDALHDAFLAYRQYRGFREAVAWSLVLPPDAPLPLRLQRYEAKAAGAYSLRQQVTLVAAALDHDLDRLVATILETAPRLPRPVWCDAYDPYPAWTATFQSLLPRMIDAAGSSDEFLARTEAARRELATSLATNAAAHVARASAARAH
jgi:hypothetical protein